jgi:ABC-type dipeptide/oligopeptide/nickel transport system permease component
LPLTSIAGFALAAIGFGARAFAKNDRLADVLQPTGANLFAVGFFATIPAVVISVAWLWNWAVPKDQKTLWAILIIVGNAIALPAFWWLVVRRTAAR